jgi:hypothetical protein
LDLRGIQLDDRSNLFFHTVTLRPSWFINTNPRQFNFIDVTWHGLENKWRVSRIKNEIALVNALGVPSPNSLLEKTCRDLAINSEESHRYEEASEFRLLVHGSTAQARLARILAHKLYLLVLAIEWLW